MQKEKPTEKPTRSGCDLAIPMQMEICWGSPMQKVIPTDLLMGIHWLTG
jgi:hypothetical protein